MADVVVLEIRGVGGTTAEEILNAPVVQTSGDKLAGFYRADAPPNPPLTEAYEWGRLTSGSRTSALWWILFPFTLMNVSGWMFRPTDLELARADEAKRSLLWTGRLIVVAGGLAITATYVIWIIALTTEMVAFGCGGDAACSAHWYMAPLSLFGADNRVWLATVGIGLAAVILLGLFLFILRTQDRLEGYETDSARRLVGVAGSSRTSRLRRNTQLEDQAFWYKWAEHRRLFRWHLGLTMVLLGAGAGHAVGRRGWQSPQGNAWLAIAGVLGIVGLMVWSLTKPERYRESSTVGQAAGNDVDRRIGWLMIHIGSAATAGLVTGLLTDRLQDATSNEFAYLAAVRALSGILYVIAIGMVGVLAWRKITSKAATTWPRALMPGLAAALAVIIAGAGFAAIANLLGRFLVGTEWIDARGYNIVIVDIFALSIIIAAIAGAIVIWRTPQPTDEVTATYFSPLTRQQLSDRQRTWVDSLARSRVIAATPRGADQMLAALTIVLVTLTIAQAVVGDFNIASGPDGAFVSPLFGIDGLKFFHTAAATGIVLYLFPGVQLIRATSKSRDSRRQIGKVWDVLSFWPRRFHPLAAPCYAERAVPEFRNRIRSHLDAGRAVVVSAHSQGTVIAFAALLQIAAESETLDIEIEGMPGSTTYADLELMVQRSMAAKHGEERPAATPAAKERLSVRNVGLVTFGSPLSSLYGPFFPWHFGTAGRFENLRSRLALLPNGKRAWRSLWRPTDYIGQKVFIAPGGELEPADEDADNFVREALQPLFPYESHSNYEREEQLRATVNSFIEGLGATAD